MKNLLAFDFSISKPAACMLYDEKYYFFTWPTNINDKTLKLFEKNEVYVEKRTPQIKLNDIMQTEIRNAINLSNDILISLKKYLPNIAYVAYEGLSYASKGNVTLSLAGWRYVFQSKLSEFIPLDNMFTYSPLTVKSVAKCSKKGMTKSDMIKMFINEGPDHLLKESLSKDVEQFQTKKAKNWIIHLDDLIDSYWTLETLRQKEVL